MAATHDEAWRAAYQGIIPGAELDKLINRRGPNWWDSAIRKGSRITVLQFGDHIAGYANYGRNRARSLFYDGEVYELYLRPEYQGLGFGRRLFWFNDADDGELTRTRKVRRGFIAERYGPLVEAMYNGDKDARIDVEVTFEDGRKGRITGDLAIADVKTFPILTDRAA